MSKLTQNEHEGKSVEQLKIELAYARNQVKIIERALLRQRNLIERLYQTASPEALALIQNKFDLQFGQLAGEDADQDPCPPAPPTSPALSRVSSAESLALSPRGKDAGLRG